MRLTKADKDAFVAAVMDDVPKVDYGEKTRSLIKQWGLESLPEDLQPLAKKYPSYFETRWVQAPAHLPSVYVVCAPDWACGGMRDKAPLLYAQLVELSQEAKQQADVLDALRRKVTGMINTCSTLKAAKKLLPEFEKYLPADRDVTGVVNLPVANVLADLTNLGWPKGEQHATAN